MEYLVKYKCSSKDGNIIEGNFVVERDIRPLNEDEEILCLARKDSTKFVKDGLAAVRIVSVGEYN